MAAAEARRLGAALGAVAAPATACGAWWGGVGETRPFVGLIALVAGALLGGLTWPVFVTDPEAPVGLAFPALFGGVAGLLAGAFAAFPIGALAGTVGGALGGAACAAGWTRLAGRRELVRVGGAACIGMAASLGLVMALGWVL